MDAVQLLDQLQGPVRVDELDVLEAIGEQLDLAVVDLRAVEIDPALLATVPPRLIRRHKIIPLDRKGDVLRVAMADPYDFRAFDALRALFPVRIEPVLASERQIRGLIRRHLIR